MSVHSLTNFPPPIWSDLWARSWNASELLNIQGLTTAQRDDIIATNGMIIYNTDTEQYEGYINGWVPINNGETGPTGPTGPSGGPTGPTGPSGVPTAECLFYANYSANVPYSVGSNTLHFNTITQNRGNTLSNAGSISTFTAPVNGYYNFNCYPNSYIVSSTTGNASLTLSLIINGTTTIFIQPTITLVNNIEKNTQGFNYFLSANDTVVANMTYSTTGDYVLGIRAGSIWSVCLVRQI